MTGKMTESTIPTSDKVTATVTSTTTIEEQADVNTSINTNSTSLTGKRIYITVYINIFFVLKSTTL